MNQLIFKKPKRPGKLRIMARGKVICQCVACKHKQTFDLARQHEMPMCEKCFSPMATDKVVR